MKHPDTADQAEPVTEPPVPPPSWFPWNGSKKWLAPVLWEVLQTTSFERYVDPFVGSGTLPRMIRATRPSVRLVLSDVNPWLVAVYEAQMGKPPHIPARVDVAHWRGLTDASFEGLSLSERALRFGVCLFSAWGNRWKTEIDGRFTSSSCPVQPKWTESNYLTRRLRAFFDVRFLERKDQVQACDWKRALRVVRAGDLVYLDPPYPEALGYGSGGWHFADLLDLIDWCAEHRKDTNIIVSNIADPSRLFERIGFRTREIRVPTTSRTRRARVELLASNVL